MPLFNVTHPSFKPHYIAKQVPDEAVPTNTAPQRPKIRTDFGVAAPAPVVVSEPAPLHTYSVDGYFSTIRACLVVTAIQQGAWEPNGLPRYLASQLPTSGDAAPSTKANADAYQNHKTMSYLPVQTEVSQDVFQSMNDATQRAAAMANQASVLAGGGSASLSQTRDNVQVSDLPLIPYTPAVPWGNALCNQSQFPVNVGTAQNPQLVQASNVPGFVSE